MHLFQVATVWNLLAQALFWASPTYVSAKLRYSEAIIENNEVGSNTIREDSDYIIPSELVGMEKAVGQL